MNGTKAFLLRLASLMLVSALAAGCEIISVKKAPPLEGERIEVRVEENTSDTVQQPQTLPTAKSRSRSRSASASASMTKAKANAKANSTFKAQAHASRTGEAVDAQSTGMAEALRGGQFSCDQWPLPFYSASHERPHGVLSQVLASRETPEGAGAGTGGCTEVRLASGMRSVEKILFGPVAQKERLFILGKGSCVHAVTPRGTVVWSASVAPSYKEERISFGGGIGCGRYVCVATAYGELFALDPATGKCVWHKELGAPTRSAPLVFQGKVAVVTLANQLEVFDEASGESLWSHSGTIEATHVLGGAMPSVSGRTLVVCYSSGEIVALDSSSGDVLWDTTCVAQRGTIENSAINGVAAPVISGNRVYVFAYGSGLNAFDLRTGQRLWSQPMEGSQTPCVCSREVLVVSADHKLLSFDKNTGVQRGCVDLPKPSQGIWAGPLLAGGRLWLCGKDALISADFSSPQKDRLLWHHDYRLRNCATGIAPIIWNGQLWCVTEQNTLIALYPHINSK